MKFINRNFVTRVLLLLSVSLAGATLADTTDDGVRYVFAWPFIDASEMRPRVGPTKGPDVQVSDQRSAAWLALNESGISKKERDRRAILAMAGPYRASFDFLETVVFAGDFKPDRPYRSWGTEYIYVVADEPEFISLQHIMVMRYEQEDGTVSEPFVIKHWRQDWRYEDRDLHVYAGDNRWRQRRLPRRVVRGKWSQAVYQVDDSPRYEATGEWIHTKSYSSWLSDETWRPLPRREFSVRDDYDVLIGTNRHTILPNGWVHEEDNLKVVLDAENSSAGRTLAREAGVNRYQRIVDFDWSAGDEYWQRTAPFWREVREAWADIYRERETFHLEKTVDGQSLFMVMFELAERLTGDEFDADTARSEIEARLEMFVTE